MRAVARQPKNPGRGCRHAGIAGRALDWVAAASLSYETCGERCLSAALLATRRCWRKPGRAAALRSAFSCRVCPVWVAKRLSLSKPACPIAGVAPRSVADYERPGEADRPQRYRRWQGISVGKAPISVLKRAATVPTDRPWHGFGAFVKPCSRVQRAPKALARSDGWLNWWARPASQGPGCCAARRAVARLEQLLRCSD